MALRGIFEETMVLASRTSCSDLAVFSCSFSIMLTTVYVAAFLLSLWISSR